MAERIRRFITSAITILIALPVLTPIWMLISGSLMRSQELESAGFRELMLGPQGLTLRQYHDMLIENLPYLSAYGKSLLYACAITLLQAAVSFLNGYVLAKVSFRGRRLAETLYLVLLVMPLQVTIVPVYLLCKAVGIYNTVWSLIVPMGFAPLGTCMMARMMRGFPDEMVEITRTDTRSTLQILLRVVLPLTLPALLALSLMTFAESWNMLEQPMLLLTDEALYPLSLLLARSGTKSLSFIWAGAVLAIVPVFLLYLFQYDYVLNCLGSLSIK